MSFWLFLRYSLVTLAMLVTLGAAPHLKGQVVDAATDKPIAGATVTVAEETTTTDINGNFETAAIGPVKARASGYRAWSSEETVVSPIRLTRFSARALYLSYYGIGSSTLREAALDLIHRDDRLNALVIDIKGDRGLIAIKTDLALAHQAGADRLATIPDVVGLLKRLHENRIYAIARIVVFKDEPLATARQDLAVRTTGGGLFRDNENLAWTDPFQHEVWQYNIDVAVQAAKAGFDEIQFDYLRFPDAKGIRLSEPSTLKSRVAAINGFLAEARRRVAPYNVFVAADIFGYVCWNTDDTGIGQKLEDIAGLVDYISPMLYPSGFTFGIPGFRDPMQHPYEIVRQSLNRAQARTGLSSLRFRPWLQAFRDYAFDRRDFDADDMEPQINAAQQFGSGGWMIWNPRNVYNGIGF